MYRRPAIVAPLRTLHDRCDMIATPFRDKSYLPVGAGAPAGRGEPSGIVVEETDGQGLKSPKSCITRHRFPSGAALPLLSVGIFEGGSSKGLNVRPPNDGE